MPTLEFFKLNLTKTTWSKKTWKLLNTPFGCLYLSRLLDSDSENHKHSTNFISLVLFGGYFEYTCEGLFKMYLPGSINKKLCGEYHKVCLLNKSKPTWILTFSY